MMHWVWKGIVVTALGGIAVAIAAGIIIASVYERPPAYYREPFRRGQKPSITKHEVPLTGGEADAKNDKTLPSRGDSGPDQSEVWVSEKKSDFFEGLECVLEAEAPSTGDSLQHCPPPYLCVAEDDGVTRRCKHPNTLPNYHASCDPANAVTCGAELRCSRSTLLCEPAIRLGESCDPTEEERCASGVCRQKRQRTLTDRQESTLKSMEEAVNGHAAVEQPNTGGDYVCQKLVTCGQPCDSTSSHCSGRCSVCGKRGVCEAPSSTESHFASVLATKSLLPDMNLDDRTNGHGDVLLGNERFENNGDENRQESKGVTDAQEHLHEEEGKTEDTEGGQGRENVDTEQIYRYDSAKEADEDGTSAYLRNATEDKGTNREDVLLGKESLGKNGDEDRQELKGVTDAQEHLHEEEGKTEDTEGGQGRENVDTEHFYRYDSAKEADEDGTSAYLRNATEDKGTNREDVLLGKESLGKNGDEDRQELKGVTDAQEHLREEEGKTEDTEGGQGRENVDTEHFYRYDSAKEADEDGTSAYLRNATEDKGTNREDVLLGKESLGKNGDEDRQELNGVTDAQEHPREEEGKTEDIEGGEGRGNVDTEHFYKYDSAKEADEDGTSAYLRNATEDKGAEREEKTQCSVGFLTSEKDICTRSDKPATEKNERSTSTATGKRYNEGAQTENPEGKRREYSQSRELANDPQHDNTEVHRLQMTSVPVIYNQNLDVEKHELGSKAGERGRTNNVQDEANTQLIQRPSQPLDKGHSVAVTRKADTKEINSTRIQPLRNTTGLDLQQARFPHTQASKDSTIHRISGKPMQTPVTQPYVGAKSIFTVPHGGSQMDDREREQRSDELRVNVPETVTSKSSSDPLYEHSRRAALQRQRAQRQSVLQRGVQLPGPYEQRPHDWQKIPENQYIWPQAVGPLRVHQSGQQYKPQQLDAPKVTHQRGHLRSQHIQQQVPRGHSEAVGQRQTEHQTPCTSAACKRLQHFDMWHRPRAAEAAQETQQQKQHWSNAQMSHGHPQQWQVSKPFRGSVTLMPSKFEPPQPDTGQSDRQTRRQERFSDEQLKGQQKRQLIQQSQTQNLQQTDPMSSLKTLWRLDEQRPDTGQRDRQTRRQERFSDEQLKGQQKRQLIQQGETQDLQQIDPLSSLKTLWRLDEQRRELAQLLRTPRLYSRQQQEHWLPEQRVRLGRGKLFPQGGNGMMPTGLKKYRRIKETSQYPPFPGRAGPRWQDAKQGSLKKVEGEKRKTTPALRQRHGAAFPNKYTSTDGHPPRTAIDALYKARKDTATRFDALLRAVPRTARN